jgi:hypothetical protein
MKLNKLVTLVLGSGVALATVGATSAKAVLIVNPTTDATLLSNTILGSGVTASTFAYTGAATASGTFTGGSSAGIGIDSGIILTSGNANLAPGPNNNASAGSSNGAAGNSILGGGTSNASTLKFDFTSSSSDLFFNFVFASEEYNEYVNTQFNDAFGFFVDGVNIALIPGTSTPIKINNVNLGSNSAYYVDNSPGSADIQYDGFTTVLTASALGLSAGTHTIEIAIADVGDSNYDSAVFLQAGTFSSTPTPTTQVPEPFTIIGTLVGGTAALRMRKKLKSSDKV